MKLSELDLGNIDYRDYVNMGEESCHYGQTAKEVEQTLMLSCRHEITIKIILDAAVNEMNEMKKDIINEIKNSC